MATARRETITCVEMGPDGESLLNEIVELAIYIDFLVVKIEEYSSYPADTINSTVKI